MGLHIKNLCDRYWNKTAFIINSTKNIIIFITFHSHGQSGNYPIERKMSSEDLNSMIERLDRSTIDMMWSEKQGLLVTCGRRN